MPCDAVQADGSGALSVPLGAGLRIDFTTSRATAAAWARGAPAAHPDLFVELHRIPLESPDDAVIAAIIEGAGALWLDLPSGPRWVRDIAMSAHDGGDHENFEAIFQAGATLPAFLSFTNADTGLSENRVTVLDDAAAGLCPR